MNHTAEISTNTRWEKYGEQEQAKGGFLVYGRNASKAYSALSSASDLAKQDINDEVEFFTIKDKKSTSLSYYTFQKNSINGINAESGTGKSFLAVEIAFRLLETKQAQKIYYVDLDRNYQSLNKRRQAFYIQNNDNFVLLTSKRLRGLCFDELMRIMLDLKEVEISYNKSDFESVKKELELKAVFLDKMLNKFDKLAFFDYLLSDYPSDDFKHLENAVFILDSINGFIPKLTDNNEVIKAFQGVLFRIIERGGTIFYLNHTTKGKKSDGELNFSGAMNLQNNSDCFILISKPFDNAMVYNIQELKNRNLGKRNYALELDLSQPIGNRIKKCDFIAIDENATQKQKDSRLIILESLRDGKKRYSDLKALFISHELSENDLNNNLRPMLNNRIISKEQVGANVFYTLAQTSTEPSQPKVYEFSDDSQIA